MLADETVSCERDVIDGRRKADGATTGVEEQRSGEERESADGEKDGEADEDIGDWVRGLGLRRQAADGDEHPTAGHQWCRPCRQCGSRLLEVLDDDLGGLILALTGRARKGVSATLEGVKRSDRMISRGQARQSTICASFLDAAQCRMRPPAVLEGPPENLSTV